MVTTRSADKRKDVTENLALRSRQINGVTPSSTPTHIRKRLSEPVTPLSPRLKRLKTVKVVATDIATPEQQQSNDIRLLSPTATESNNLQIRSGQALTPSANVQVIVPPVPGSRSTVTSVQETFHTPATSKHKRFGEDDVGSEADDTIVVNQEPGYETANEVLNDSDGPPETEIVSKASAKGRKRRPKASDFLDDVVEKDENAQAASVAGKDARDDKSHATSTTAPQPDIREGTNPKEHVEQPQQSQMLESVTIDNQPTPDRLSSQHAMNVMSSTLFVSDGTDANLHSGIAEPLTLLHESTTASPPPEPEIAIDTAPPAVIVPDFIVAADFMPVMSGPQRSERGQSMESRDIIRTEAKTTQTRQKIYTTFRSNPKQHSTPGAAKSSLSRFRADKMCGRANLESTWKGKRSAFISS